MVLINILFAINFINASQDDGIIYKLRETLCCIDKEHTALYYMLTDMIKLFNNNPEKVIICKESNFEYKIYFFKDSISLDFFRDKFRNSLIYIKMNEIILKLRSNLKIFLKYDVQHIYSNNEKCISYENILKDFHEKIVDLAKSMYFCFEASCTFLEGTFVIEDYIEKLFKFRKNVENIYESYTGTRVGILKISSYLLKQS
ncbi:hypothetical protein H311_03705 [Anncaliia algerae PRA109]|nr:hypothetical protein H311_03705 [Anncaliia algerae PRA109]